MAESPVTLRVDVGETDSVTLIVAEGELDLASAGHLGGVAADLAGRSSPVVLDMSRVSFMDSSGMRALLQVADAAVDAGRPFALLRPSTAVTRLLDLVELRPRFPEVTDLDDASLAALTSA